MTLTADMETALAADAPLCFIAVQFQLPGYDLNLADGPSANISFGGNSFVSPDPTYGTLGPIDQVGDGSQSQAPHLKIQILCPSNAAATTLAAAANQGCPVYIWMGCVNRSTGLVVDSPDLWFAGEIDVGALHVGLNASYVEMDVASVFERFFDVDEGIGLSDASHQSYWPGELGMQFVTSITSQLPWGAKYPHVSPITTSTANVGVNRTPL